MPGLGTTPKPTILCYDPGIYERDLEELGMTQQLLHAKFRAQADSSPVIVPGYVLTLDDEVKLSRVLFDSGALSSSYINQDIVDEHREKWSPYIIKVDGQVRLADQTTVVKITERIKLPVGFKGEHGWKAKASVEMTVMPMPGLDMIIGLPDIIDSLPFLFC
jgi:hypothetical protein